MPAPPRRPLAAALVGALWLVGGCGDGQGDAAGACGPIVRESLDSAYLVHVLGSDTEVRYTSDPPTSGPHQPGPPVEGAVDEPLPRPIQVGVLERGDVLLQYDPSLPAGDVAALTDLAGGGVVVAPNPDLDDPVVATAWLHKRVCQRVDPGPLAAFVDERLGNGPED